MAPIDVAMARSLHGGMWGTLRDSVVRSVTNEIAKRNIIDDTHDKVTDVKTAFSSWDNCMNATFCKYPVIAVIIVGGLILLAIISCIVRCCCCAKACCCSCFRCFQCCGNCCGCCDPPESRKHKYLDEPYIPPNQGYQTQAPMNITIAPTIGGGAGPPQYAEFESNKKGGEDSLPQMPSWEGASSKKVELEEESHEMNNLKAPAGRNDTNSPMMTGVSPSPASPMPRENLRGNSPYGPPGGSEVGSMRGGPIPRGTPVGGPMAGPPMGNPRDPYAPQNQGFDNYHNQGPGDYHNQGPGDYHNQGPNSYGYDQPYDMPPPAGMPMAAAGGMSGRNSPAPTYRTNPQHGPGPMNPGFTEMPNMPPNARDPYGPGSPAIPPVAAGAMGGPAGYGMRRPNNGEDPYGPPRTGSPYGMPGPNRGGNNSPAPYGMDPSMRGSPAPPGARRTPAPHGDPYNQSPRGSPAPNSPGFGRPPFAQGPGPDRQYAQSPRPTPHRPGHDQGHSSPVTRPFAQDEPPASPITNSGGFDFTSGFSRPESKEQHNYDRRPSESRETPGLEGYPGYKPYQPAQEGWSGV